MIKVLIERQVPEELTEQYLILARQALTLSMQGSGFISGEVLHDINNPERRLVIASYRTIQDWDRWYNSEQRREIMDQLGPMLEHEEKICIYEH